MASRSISDARLQISLFLLPNYLHCAELMDEAVRIYCQTVPCIGPPCSSAESFWSFNSLTFCANTAQYWHCVRYLVSHRCCVCTLVTGMNMEGGGNEHQSTPPDTHRVIVHAFLVSDEHFLKVSASFPRQEQSTLP